MPHVIANGLEREATIHQALDASMPESVGPRPGHWNARPMEILAGETGDGRLSQWPTGRDMPPKELPTLCFGPSVLEVINDRFANNGRQRIGGSMVGLALADVQSVALPVDIVESQVGDLAGAKAIRDHEQQHSVIAPTTDSPYGRPGRASSGRSPSQSTAGYRPIDSAAALPPVCSGRARGRPPCANTARKRAVCCTGRHS